MYSRIFTNNLLKIYEDIKPKIVARIDEFRDIWENGNEEVLFRELIFCLLTPQSKAKCCWAAVEQIFGCNVIASDDEAEILKYMTGIRFKYTKAKNVIKAKEIFFINGMPQVRRILKNFASPADMREWLVASIRGMGYKEASHFLRNIGIGFELAILDRHILKNLTHASVIDAIPEHLSRRKYFDIEDKMRKFSRVIEIPMSHLDLLLWYKETGEVFK